MGSACDAAPVGDWSGWNQGDYYVLGGSSKVLNPDAAVSIVSALQGVAGVTLTVADNDSVGSALAAIGTAACPNISGPASV